MCSCVGTGPGDPEFANPQALRVIKSADLCLYDRLVSNDVLDLVGPMLSFCTLGRLAGYHSRTQEEIHELLLSFAEAGANVVRLKGGDPLVTAELGIPLTHRGVATSVRFLTGHSRKGGSDPLFVAENAADPDSTLVIYMGLSTLPSLASKLMYHGLPDDTPAAAIERGTTPQQRIVFAELKNLADEIASSQLASPTLIIIGKVVALSPLWPHAVNEASTLVESR
ncbi:siroheme synthase [Phtheirospermum japonicum]|uniref:Siroheme synthase n=1 Tax=Phtheirospermum japonicum TaxID=374723 RepID=A0A830C4N7_9LAMI|nr:siroheme synthase [Phtheirospermum japonicum]